ncbi:hypothetical protein BT67DRAFT_192561 [Trichocladium antarcticum]|uniref:Uncharacterized protein n=1 Tax=Trichocladium antarcticum TaxID=1450529 RepID=A0AAN6ZGK4_9PEZI|nr:hypothetical protein BT67DRAFT_192561 [Trichocladium antarcticum]
MVPRGTNFGRSGSWTLRFHSFQRTLTLFTPRTHQDSSRQQTPSYEIHRTEHAPQASGSKPLSTWVDPVINRISRYRRAAVQGFACSDTRDVSVFTPAAGRLSFKSAPCCLMYFVLHQATSCNIWAAPIGSDNGRQRDLMTICTRYNFRKSTPHNRPRVGKSQDRHTEQHSASMMAAHLDGLGRPCPCDWLAGLRPLIRD